MDREDINGGRLTPEERRERVKKLKRKRRFRLAIVVGGFASVFLVLLSAIVLTFVLRVKHFVIEGETLYTDKEIVQASGIEKGKSLLFADLDEAKINVPIICLPAPTQMKIFSLRSSQVWMLSRLASASQTR